jgi:hypothetical protein
VAVKKCNYVLFLARERGTGVRDCCGRTSSRADVAVGIAHDGADGGPHLLLCTTTIAMAEDAYTQRDVLIPSRTLGWNLHAWLFEPTARSAAPRPAVVMCVRARTRVHAC